MRFLLWNSASFGCPADLIFAFFCVSGGPAKLKARLMRACFSDRCLVGMVPPRQVTPTFDCSVDSSAGKATLVAQKKDMQKRQVAWVQRGLSGRYVLWKPQKRHRLAAKHIVQNLDNQVLWERGGRFRLSVLPAWRS